MAGVMLKLEDLEYNDRRTSLRARRVIPISSESLTDQELDIESHPICGVCFFPLPRSGQKCPTDYKHFRDICPVGNPIRGLPHFRRSCQRGCETCRHIVSKVLQISTGTAEDVRLEMDDNLRVSVVPRGSCTERSFVFNLFIAEPEERAGKSARQQFQPDALAGTEKVGKDGASKYLNYYLTHRTLTLPIESYTGSDEISSRINTWLMECQRTHPSCQPSQNASLPRRILEIDVYNCLFRLLEDCVESYSYACLSHRWGATTKDVSLKQANIQQRKSWTPIDSLPCLFRDAMLVVANAGLRYLWIDCLCIIQDSKYSEDWHREAAEMANIYQNASFTVVATWCSSSDQSLFSTVDDAYQPVSIDNDGEKGGVLRVWPEHPDLWADREDQQRQHFPLLGRGWVFQEVVLSRKLLLFGRNEVYWICRQASWCLCGITNAASAHLGLIRQAQDLTSFPWANIVTQFTSMDLTFPTDRLPALAGIADRYGALHKLTYVAGHWKENLTEELLWTGGGGLEGKPRPYPLMAPTWSWACTDGPIDYSWKNVDGRQLGNGIKIGLPKITLLGAGIYGQVRSARLPLRIPIVRGQIFYGRDAVKFFFGESPLAELSEAEVDADQSKEPSEIEDDAGKSKLENGSKRSQRDEDFEQFLPKLVVVIVGGEWAIVCTDYALYIEGPGHVMSGSEITIAIWMVDRDSVEALNGFVLHRVGQESEKWCYERLGIICQDDPDSVSFAGSTDKFWGQLLSYSTLEDLILV